MKIWKRHISKRTRLIMIGWQVDIDPIRRGEWDGDLHW